MTVIAEIALRNWLLPVADVDQRIYPKVAPQDATHPAIAYQRISTQNITRRGRSSLEHIRFQLTIVATSYLSARQLADQIKRGIEQFDCDDSGQIMELSWTNDSDQPIGQTTGNQPVRLDILMKYCKGAIT